MVVLFLLQRKYNQFYVEDENEESEEIETEDEDFFDKGL